MKFSIILAVAALSAETFACANIGQVCQKGDPDVCQCDAPLTLSCRGDLATRPGGARRFHYQLGDICPLLKRNGRCVNGKCVPGPRLTAVTPTPTPE
ncbi:hypothetical protein FOXG_12285 [Fusarium oxysporum f. sp. lycopersici 4287]|uniref:Extracellular membrane protein CFEM domain-containing protein n=2 Tax=Fusarium oxysporum TaxID=5507 RepID=A0A0J9VNY3_FUSO4|nr:hypothetical protein FOXG_12285 [Fusarium oxysporum f. sp. lycopersici 4287]EXK28965.1 hypothetical protein FOMG_14817 [Fusarium oxysporum f. sp. melonis 26406]KAJ9414398.1 hypothetical protein QL093DRAFT_2106868 [Fusarium oxysporum]KNB12784.1 hypothetical protein FOXG_12285 [Fusarium oxysporum f. sp. lycopersici 4287]